MKRLLIFCCCPFLFFACSNSSSKKRIAIQPFGNIDTSALKYVEKFIEEVYDKDVIVLDKKELPQSAFVNIKTPRYRADSIIRYLKRSKPDSLDIILGFTAKDISTTKKDKYGNVKKPKSRYQDWGIFGLGYRPGPSCVVSSFRLKHNNRKRFIHRLMKVSVHEIGHNLGLKHCIDKACIMTDACESIKTVDKVSMSLCARCKKKI